MMEQDIINFIEEQKVATVCCVEHYSPYCFNCYYAFLKDAEILVYKSSFGTKHEAIMKNNNLVAGTIIPEQIELATIRGIQFEGILLEETIERTMKASSAYYLKFPFAFAVPGRLYSIQINHLKFTDNTKGFGFKQEWNR